MKLDSRLRGNDEVVSALRCRCQRSFSSPNKIISDTESVAHIEIARLYARGKSLQVGLKGDPQNKIARGAGSYEII